MAWSIAPLRFIPFTGGPSLTAALNKREVNKDAAEFPVHW